MMVRVHIMSFRPMYRQFFVVCNLNDEIDTLFVRHLDF